MLVARDRERAAPSVGAQEQGEAGGRRDCQQGRDADRTRGLRRRVDRPCDAVIECKDRKRRSREAARVGSRGGRTGGRVGALRVVANKGARDEAVCGQRQLASGLYSAGDRR